MRPLLATLLVLFGSVAAWGIDAGRDEGAERRAPGRFLDVLAPGDSVLLVSKGEGFFQYSVTVLNTDELRQLRPTPEEVQEFRELEAEMKNFRGQSYRDWREQHEPRYLELSKKITQQFREIIEVGEDFVGWRYDDGRVQYVPERRIHEIFKNRPAPRCPRH